MPSRPRPVPARPAASGYLELVRAKIFGWHPAARGAALPGGRRSPRGVADADPATSRTRWSRWRRGRRGLLSRRPGRAIAADMAANGGLLGGETSPPMSRWSARAVRGPAGWQLPTNPPPAIGGAVLARCCCCSAGRRCDAGRPTSGRWLAVIIAAAAAPGSAGWTPPSDRAAAAAERCSTDRRSGPGWLRTSASTAHVSAVDGDGMACAITASAGYGSGVMPPAPGSG